MKKYLFKRKFRKIKDRTIPQPEYLERISSVNLIFDATEEENRALAKRFKSDFERNKCTVNLLGYLNYRLKGEENSFGFPIYDRSAVNWYGIPKSEEIDTFCTQSVEATITLNLQDLPHMDFIGKSCRSFLKIGVSTSHGSYQDIFISIKENTVKEFLDASRKILKELRLSPERKATV